MSREETSGFVGETVRVSWVQEIGYKRPTAIALSGGDLAVQEVLMKWEDHGFGQSPPKKRPWYLRRHRTYYRVKTGTGRVFELYLDRGAPKETWVLVKEIHP
jgi:hypothetical protein